MKPGSFKTIMEVMAECMAGVLKKDGFKAAKVIKKQKIPKYKEHEEENFLSKKQELKFAYDYESWMQKESNWEETSGHIFEKLSSHSTPGCKAESRSNMIKMGFISFVCSIGSILTRTDPSNQRRR